MSPATTLGQAEACTTLFGELPFYRREEAELSNWYGRVFTGQWQTWAGEAFAGLLQTAARTETRLVVKHSLEEGKQEALHKLSGGTVTIGRSPDNEIMLPAQSVTKQHARIVFESGGCFLEDLGSTLGTYVANQKLAPHKRISLAPGTQFTIFPYLLTVEERFEWVSGAQAEISQPVTVSTEWGEFLASSALGSVHFPVSVHPPGLAACLEAGGAFLEHLLTGMLAASGPSPALAGLLPTDGELLGFLLLSVLERANRNLRFPFQFLLGKPLERPLLNSNTRGIACSFSVAWTGFTGAFRFFLPDDLLAGMRKAWPASGADWRDFSRVSWMANIFAGYADLTAHEVSGLEPGDVVLLTEQALLELPGIGCFAVGQTTKNDGLLHGILVERFLKRRVLMEVENSEAVDAKNPDLSGLPIRLHVVLGEKEMTLAELGALQSGSILELDRDKSGQVDVAVNGKLAGKGTLVEIEGKLGVKISELEQRARLMQNLLADYLKLMLVLAGIVALAYAALRYWLPKISGLQQRAGGPIQVIARMPLEPRKNLYIVKAGSEYLLVGTAENSVHMISALQADALEGYAASAAKPEAAPPEFLTVLRRLKRS